jgi:hypothetical protein
MALATTTNQIGGSGPSGACRGIYAVGTSRFLARDTNILATGPTGTANCIGCEVANTGSLVSLKSCSVGGSLVDVKQASYGGPSGPTGSLQLMATDMINDNAGENGFLVGVNPMTLNLYSTIGNTSQTSFVVPGTLANQSTTAQGILFNQKTTITGISMMHHGTITTANSIVVTLYNTTTPTTGSSGTLIGTFGLPAQASGVFTTSRFLNFTATIDPTLSPPQFLQVKVTTTTGVSTGLILAITIGTY